jgi:hypothetical protein
MNYSIQSVSKSSAKIESASRFILTHAQTISITLLSLIVSHIYGHFLWGDFYKQYLWIISIAFFLESGSNHLLRLSLIDDNLEDEIKQGLQSRIVILLFSCILLLFLPFVLLHSLSLSMLLLFRFAGDVLIALQRLRGNNKRAALAELIFWLILITAFLLPSESFSAKELIFQCVGAAGIRFMIADPRLLRSIFPLANHAPDAEWIKKSIQKFLPQLSGFLFFSADILLASLLLPNQEFSFYQITIGITAALCIVLNNLLSGKRSISLAKTITFASLAMVPTVIALRFVLTEYSIINLTPWYLPAAYCTTVSGAILAFFVRWLLQDRELIAVQTALLALSALHVIVFPFLLLQSNLEALIIYQGAFHLLSALVFTVVAYRKGYK